nr:unnamed protein product [Callosobruchus chinensis]
MTTDITWK